MWPTRHHKELVLKICESSKTEICAGMEGEAAVVEGARELNATAIGSSGGCPFSGASGAGGRCPFTGASGGGDVHIPRPSAPAAAPPASAGVARSVSTVSESSTRAGGVMAGRVLGSSLQQQL